MPTAEGAGVPLAYSIHGEGETVLLIHDIAADAAAWEQLPSQLGARVLTYDRRGYGGSGAPEPYERTTVEEQAEDAAALLHAAAPEGAILCGEGFGALVALDLLKRHPSLTRSAVVLDPPLYAFVPEATEVLAAERELLERTLRESGPAAAVEAWLGGRRDSARAREAHRAFFADYAGLASWPVTRAELRAMTAPVAVVSAPGSPRHLVAAADALARLLPHAGRRSDGDLVAAISELL